MDVLASFISASAAVPTEMKSAVFQRMLKKSNITILVSYLSTINVLSISGKVFSGILLITIWATIVARESDSLSQQTCSPKESTILARN